MIRISGAPTLLNLSKTFHWRN